MQRPFNSNPEGMARNITPTAKNLSTDIPVKPGMRNRSAPGAMSGLGTPEHAGAQPLNDETLDKNWHGKSIPEHPGMSHPTQTRDNRAKLDPAAGSRVLTDAANLGRPPEKA
jgi:hypothetical protein